MSLNIHHIWNPDTGITGLNNSQVKGEDNSQYIAVEWKVMREQHKNNTHFLHFLEKLNREWAIETGVIEGIYTLDKGTTTTLIEHGFKESLIQHGSSNLSAGELVDVLNDHLNALEMIYDFIKDNRQISTSFIKELHAAVTRSQESTDAITPDGKRTKIPLLKGEWKVNPNNPGREGSVYSYCPPEQTSSEMDKLISLFIEYETNKVPPCTLAAWFHHRFTQIHPFQDGNGRVVRALATAILIKADLFYFNIKRGEPRKEYITALEEADAGYLDGLIELFDKQQRSILLAAKIEVESAKALIHKTTSSEKTLTNQLRKTKELEIRSSVIKININNFYPKFTTEINSALEIKNGHRQIKTLRNYFPYLNPSEAEIVSYPDNSFGINKLFGNNSNPRTIVLNELELAVKFLKDKITGNYIFFGGEYTNIEFQQTLNNMVKLDIYFSIVKLENSFEEEFFIIIKKTYKNNIFNFNNKILRFKYSYLDNLENLETLFNLWLINSKSDVLKMITENN